MLPGIDEIFSIPSPWSVRSILDAATVQDILLPAPPTTTAVKPAGLTDEVLMLLLCQGEKWALEVLHQRYSRYTYALAYRILHDPLMAEDIVQETFLSVWLKAALYQKQQGSVRSWLQAIVHHKSIDRVRSSAHRDMQCAPLQVENEQDPASQEPEVWEEVWQHEQSVIIRSALAELPSEQRQVIELSYFGGYTHMEIAEHWNIPLGTVKGRMRLGLQKMKDLLCKRGIDPANL
jgi:RNA polymerase sigma-70 factor (ECF subfamily)